MQKLGSDRSLSWRLSDWAPMCFKLCTSKSYRAVISTFRQIQRTQTATGSSLLWCCAPATQISSSWSWPQQLRAMSDSNETSNKWVSLCSRTQAMLLANMHRCSRQPCAIRHQQQQRLPCCPAGSGSTPRQETEAQQLYTTVKGVPRTMMCSMPLGMWTSSTQP